MFLSADLIISACGRYKKQLKRVKPIKLADWVFFCFIILNKYIKLNEKNRK